jgi:hypothetical protein
LCAFASPLLFYVQNYGDDNLVVVVSATSGVPITVVACDPAVLLTVYGLQSGSRNPASPSH